MEMVMSTGSVDGFSAADEYFWSNYSTNAAAVSVGAGGLGDYSSSNTFVGKYTENFSVPGDAVGRFLINAANHKLKISIRDDATGKTLVKKTVEAGKTYTLDSIALHAGRNYSIQFDGGGAAMCTYNLNYYKLFDAVPTNRVEPADFNSYDIVSGYVGWNNPKEVFTFTVSDANVGSYSFSIGRTSSKIKYSLIQVNDAGKKTRTIKSKTLPNGDDIYHCNLEQGKYQIEVLSADNGKGKYNTNYMMAGFRNDFRVGVDSTNNTMATATPFSGAPLSGYVGFADKVNYYKVDGNGKFNNFFLDSSTNKYNVKLSLLNAKGKKLKTFTAKKGDVTVSDILLKNGATYYIKVDAVSTKGDKDVNYTMIGGFNSFKNWTQLDSETLRFVDSSANTDYLAFKGAGKVNFNLDLTDNSKKVLLEVYTFDGNDNMKKLKGYTTNKDKSFTLNLSANQQYFVKIASVGNHDAQYDLILKNAMIA